MNRACWPVRHPRDQLRGLEGAVTASKPRFPHGAVTSVVSRIFAACSIVIHPAAMAERYVGPEQNSLHPLFPCRQLIRSSQFNRIRSRIARTRQ